MLYFLGNCQMDFLSREVGERGLDVSYRVLASPFTYNSSPAKIPQKLEDFDRKLGLKDFYHGRILSHQFEMISPNDPEPELIVLNLFHENSPLFIHDEHKYIFFIDPKSWEEHPEFENWMKSNFGMIGANPATYLKRYSEMLVNLRKQYPHVPVVVVSRLSHFPAFGPDPYSYLEGWGNLWQSAADIFRQWEAEIDGLSVIDMDRIFGGIWAGSDKRIESHCPFLKFELTEENNVITGLHASRDVEHIGSMWKVLAGKIEFFMAEGEVRYNEGETVPNEWMIPWQPEKIDHEKLLEMLSSGGNYLCARAIGSFFLDLNNDYTELLVETAGLTPVCHNTLHMIRTYGRIWRNPRLANWCREHRKTAEAFTANGPLYMQDYLNRLDVIEEFVLNS